MSLYERVIINKLLDSYESSKTFTGDNKVSQKFSAKITELFPKYGDHSNYEEFESVNEAVTVLFRKNLITTTHNTANVHNVVVLNINQLDANYAYIGRTPKKDINTAVLMLLDRYQYKNDILAAYCTDQRNRISLNKSIHYFNDNVTDLENILIAVDHIVKVEKETFVRDFSMRVFKESKKFERIIARVTSLLFDYGDFPKKETVLGDLNIIKVPPYVYFKGAGQIIINGQIINLTTLGGDIGISSKLLPSVENIAISGKAVITIENLTSFHTFNDDSMFAIYLGGFHNTVRREFIKRIYHQNANVDYHHFGDIDAGGFYVLEHLKRKTGVNFKPYKMDVATLQHYWDYIDKLTENDVKRLTRLLDSEHQQVIEYMLANNCKLEQESTNVK